jgi:hypothetical protein
MAFSDCAAKTCEALTAMPFGALALFLKACLWATSGWNSCMKMPASFVTPVLGFVDAEMAATNCSVSMAGRV